MACRGRGGAGIVTGETPPLKTRSVLAEDAGGRNRVTVRPAPEGALCHSAEGQRRKIPAASRIAFGYFTGGNQRFWQSSQGRTFDMCGNCAAGTIGVLEGRAGIEIVRAESGGSR